MSVEVFSVDTNAISYTLTPETAGSCGFAEPVPGCSPRFEREGARVVKELETRLKASTATWKVRQLDGAGWTHQDCIRVVLQPSTGWCLIVYGPHALRNY